MTTLTEQMLRDIQNNDRWEKLYELFINSGKNFYEAWGSVNEIWDQESKNIEEIYKLEYEKFLDIDVHKSMELYTKYWTFKMNHHHPITYYKNECVIIQCSVCLYSKHKSGREQVECPVCFARVCVGTCESKHKNVCKKPPEPIVIYYMGEKRKKLFGIF